MGRRTLRTAPALGAIAMLALSPAAAVADDPVVPRFAEVTASSGIDHVYDGEWQHFVGGGVAVFDCDDDGRPELYLAGGTNPATLWHNESARTGTIGFRRIADPATDVRRVSGAYPIDIDGDDVLDLAVLRVGEDLLLRGLGGCRFERANERWGFDGGDRWTTAFAATWEAGAALPALAFGSYVDLGDSTRRVGSCDYHRLFRPRPGETTYGKPLLLAPGYCALSMLFSDWSRTGRRDLRVSNDRHYAPGGQEQLWRFAPGEPVIPWTEAQGWRPLSIWGMGIASTDLTGDGRPEVFLTSQGDDKLQTLAPGAEGPSYEDIALDRGATVTRPAFGGDVLPSTSWHAEFGDANNDGLPDLLIAKGNVEAQPEYAAKDPSELLVGRPDGGFDRPGRATGLVTFDRSRGGALADLDLDGLADVVLVGRREPVRIWRGIGTGTADAPVSPGGWIDLRLRAPAPNTRAVGAWVEVRAGDRTRAIEVTVGGGHAGGTSSWIHAGLGDAPSAEVRVTWPDGSVGPWQRVAAGSRVVIERGADAPLAWSPPAAPATGRIGGSP